MKEWICSVISNLLARKLIIFLVILSVSFLYFMYSTVPTRIRIDFTIDHITFNVAKENIEFDLPEFSSVKFTNFSQADIELDFKPIIINNNLVMKSSEIEIKGNKVKDSSIEFRNNLNTNISNSLDFSITKNSEVEMDYENKNLVIGINYPKSEDSIYFEPIENTPLSLKLKSCETKVNNKKFDYLSLDIESEGISLFTINKLFEYFSIGFKILDNEKTFEIFSRKYITSIRTSHKLFDSDNWVTSVKKGKISYPDYPNVPSVDFDDNNIILFGKNTFYVKQFQLDPKEEVFSIKLYGKAEEKISICPEDYKCGDESDRDSLKDYRLTRYDTYSENRLWMAGVDIATWLIPVLIGVFITINVRIKNEFLKV
ncbi:MAG: hypothetical protein QM487_16055, partial [Candidatus Marithrix sp.]